MSNSSDSEKKQIEQTKSIMAKLAAMPHKPHVAKKKPAKKVRKKPND